MESRREYRIKSESGIAVMLKLAIILLLIIAQTGCSRAGSSGSGDTVNGKTVSEPVTSENYYLDTVCRISVYGMGGEAANSGDMDEDGAKAAIDKAWELCAALDKQLSKTVESSDISRINAAGGEWVEVEPDTIDLINKGIEYSRMSDGDFDITIGGVTELWDFHADEDEAALPDPEALMQAVGHVNYKGLEIEGNRVRLTDPETKIDLGGIAKGYIGDLMTELLEEEGVTSGIINLGGNVICIGGKGSGADNAGESFMIGVELPYSDRTEIAGKIPARDMTLVTSGIYERKIEVDGKLYHHILSTGTGYPADSDLTAVTLTAAKGHSADIDALSTICLIKGYDKARELIESLDGIEAVFIKKDGSIEKTSDSEFEMK